MHPGEVPINEPLVRRLLAAQFPHLASLSLAAVRSTGTVNVIYRLGDDLCVRLPRVATWANGVERELEWLPCLAPQLPLAIPEAVHRGAPTPEYPFTWAVYRWIDGEPYDDPLVRDERAAARALADFITALRRIDPTGAPPTGRRPLRELDLTTRKAIKKSGGEIDAPAATDAWSRALDAPAWDRDTDPPVWIHTDLLRPNMLVRNGALSAVIDFGGVGVGDPAADLIAAWAVFNPPGRAAFRAALAPDSGTWERARGYALHQAALVIPYYPDTNPGFVVLARRTIEQILADQG